MAGGSYTRTEWLLLVSLSANTFAGALVTSLQAPFYPQEAEKKGATATEYGLVFGIFELAKFVIAPVFGIYMGVLGANLVLKSGFIILGISSVSFGMLSYVDGRVWFIGLSFLVRVVEALGASAMYTASLSIIVVSFSDSFVRVFTTLEIFQGLGYMAGPTVGGFLFEIGGFVCPFAVVGAFVLVSGVFIACTLPKLVDAGNGNTPKTALLSVLKILPVTLDAITMLVQSTTIGFLLATLEPHIREFNLSPSALGGVFVISGLVYTLASPLVGYLCDKNFHPKKLILVGILVTIMSFMCIGPVPFTPLENTLWLVCIGLVLDGFATSMLFVPALVGAITSSVKYGLPNDITTYALVSGIYCSSFALGAFIGPSIAGVLFDTVGFRKGSLFIVAIQSALFCSVSWYLCIEKKYNQRNISLQPEVSSNGFNPDTLGLKVAGDLDEVLPLFPKATAQRNTSYNSISQETN